MAERRCLGCGSTDPKVRGEIDIMPMSSQWGGETRPCANSFHNSGSTIVGGEIQLIKLSPRVQMVYPNPDEHGVYVGDIRIVSDAPLLDENGNMIGKVEKARFGEGGRVIEMQCVIEDVTVIDQMRVKDFSAKLDVSFHVEEPK